MQKIAHFIDQCNSIIGKTVSWLSLAMVLTMFTAVVLRYVAEASTIWQMELVRYFHAILFLSAAGYTLQCDEHVRVDVFYRNASQRFKSLVNIGGVVLLVIPVTIAILYFSSDFIINSWAIWERSPEYDGLPGIFIFKSFIWVFALFVLLQAIGLMLKSLLNLKEAHG